MQEQGGVAGVRDLADYFEVSEARVRDFAYDNDVPKIGNTIVFQTEDAEALEADLAEEEEADDDLGAEEDGDEPEDDEPDDDDDDEPLDEPGR